MSFHTEDSKCPGCEKMLEQCHPDWKAIFHDIKAEFPDCHISCGFRDRNAQEEVYKLGLSRARWPQSKHNFMRAGKPCSLALDLFQIDDEGEAKFKKSYYLEIAQFLNKLGEDVEWSGDWKNFKEHCHFQISKERV